MNNYEDDFLTLSLSINTLPNLGASPLSLPLPPPPPLSNVNNEGARIRVGLTNGRMRRTSTSTQSTVEEKNETITPPYPWATSRHAIIHTLDYLVSKEITSISGDVQCKKCQQQYKIQYDLQEKFNEIAKFIFKNKKNMHDRAPPIWMDPKLPNCKYCKQRNCVKPIISNHAITNRKLLDLKSQIEIKTSSSIFGQMLPKGVPIPPSAPSCRSSPGTPPSCPFPQPEMVDDVASLTP
ncbi:hypothetical protein H5410_044983 [Solanum commersonii]|uniref:DUF7086 domain-containing protein n=1 Tax=Solanum commersonii TaxID=4109 RepID=A0A9J5XAG2_SOLCO|nr:hypothetical protein H5410_044983 [Solanum commersonii]